MLYVVDVANLAFGVLHEEEEHLDVALLVLTVFLFLVDLGWCAKELAYASDEARLLVEAFKAEVVEVLFTLNPFRDVHGLSALFCFKLTHAPAILRLIFARVRTRGAWARYVRLSQT